MNNELFILDLKADEFPIVQRPNPKKNMVYETPQLSTTSPYVHSRVDSNAFTMGNPMPESTLSLS
jgi:hypothetical protein